MPELVAACCVLHNVREVHGDTFNEDWLEGIESTTDINITDARSSQHPTSIYGLYFQEHSLYSLTVSTFHIVCVVKINNYYVFLVCDQSNIYEFKVST